MGARDEPIAAVLFRNPSSIPPKQFWSVQSAVPLLHCRRKRRPVELYLNATVIPAAAIVAIWVSFQSLGN